MESHALRAYGEFATTKITLHESAELTYEIKH